MKILVIADSHGNIANINHVMGFGEEIKAEGIIHCGDWDNIASVETVLSFKIPLYSVPGNADVDPNLEFLLASQCKKFDQKFLEFELDGRRIGLAHRIQDLVTDGKDIAFCGHVQKQFKKGIIVNPGALENDISFAVYDTKTNKVEFING